MFKVGEETKFEVGDKVQFEVHGTILKGVVASDAFKYTTEGYTRDCHAVFLGYDNGFPNKEDTIFVSALIVHKGNLEPDNE